MQIEECKSDLPSLKPIKERMDIHIPDVSLNLPHRNGFVYMLCGSGGSGKSSLLMAMFKSRDYYRYKFHTIYYFCPEASMMSVIDHPFKGHENVYTELTEDTLQAIREELEDVKATCVREKFPMENSCIIIDDFGSHLKDNDLVNALNRTIIRTRHLGCSWIFTLQSYYLCPKILRKQCTNATIFRPRNAEEWKAITKELLMMNNDKLEQLEAYVFDQPYNHLDIDTFENRIFKNFCELKIKDKKEFP